MSMHSELTNPARLVHPEHEESSWIIYYSKRGAFIGGGLALVTTSAGLFFVLFSGLWWQSHLGLYLVWAIGSMVVCFLYSIVGVLIGALCGQLASRIKQKHFHTQAVQDAVVEISQRKKMRAILRLAPLLRS